MLPVSYLPHCVHFWGAMGATAHREMGPVGLVGVALFGKTSTNFIIVAIFVM